MRLLTQHELDWVNGGTLPNGIGIGTGNDSLDCQDTIQGCASDLGNDTWAEVFGPSNQGGSSPPKSSKPDTLVGYISQFLQRAGLNISIQFQQQSSSNTLICIDKTTGKPVFDAQGHAIMCVYNSQSSSWSGTLSNGVPVF